MYSEANAETLDEEVTDLRSAFERYDTHVQTTVYGDTDGDVAAVASLWDTEDAAQTASDYLTDLPGVVGRHGEGDGFGTMGMFYTVKSEYREDFVEKFDTVGEYCRYDGHRRPDCCSTRRRERHVHREPVGLTEGCDGLLPLR